MRLCAIPKSSRLTHTAAPHSYSTITTTASMSRNQVYESHDLAIAVTGRDPLAGVVANAWNRLFTTPAEPQPLDEYNARHGGRPVRFFCRMVGDRRDSEGLWRNGGNWELNRDVRLLEEAVFTKCPQLMAECARQNAEHKNDMLLIRQGADRAIGGYAPYNPSASEQPRPVIR